MDSILSLILPLLGCRLMFRLSIQSRSCSYLPGFYLVLLAFSSSVFGLLPSGIIGSAAAQDDPFGGGDLFDSGGGNVFLDPAAPAAAADVEKVTVSPLTQQLLNQAAGGNALLAESVSSLSRTGRWAEVDRLLSSLDTKKLSDAVKADMAKRIGATEYLKISGRDDVSAAAKANLSELAKASNRQAQSPARIQAAIESLEAVNSDDRTAAARFLFSGGNVSVAAMADQLTRRKSVVKANSILPVYVRFGDFVAKPLERYALYGDSSRRENALVMLGRISVSSSRLAALTAFHSQDASEREREIAASLVHAAFDRTPSFEQTASMLMQDMKRKRDVTLLIDRNRQTETLWTVVSESPSDDSGTSALLSVRPIKSTQLVAAYRDVVDSAARLKRLGRLSVQSKQAILEAELAYRLIRDPDWGDVSEVDSLRRSMGFVVDEELLLASIDDSMKRRDDAAMLGLLRWIAADGKTADGGATDRRLAVSKLLQHGGAAGSPLVRLASSAAEPRIRFEAALAIARMAKPATENGGAGVPYAGRSLVSKTLSEITRVTNRPLAILVETRPGIALSIEGMLSDLGYDVTVVESVARLLNLVDAGGDLQLIIAKTQLWDLPPIELVDRVRRTSRGRSVPIVLYSDRVTDRVIDERPLDTSDVGFIDYLAEQALANKRPLVDAQVDGSENQVAANLLGEDSGSAGFDPADEVRLGEHRWDALTIQIPRPASVAALDRVREVSSRRARVSSLSHLDRSDFRVQAIELLEAK